MEEKNNNSSVEPNLDYQGLIELRKRFEDEQKDYLNLCYQYLNFYIGIILSILGITIAGILQIIPGNLRYLVILAGPLVSIFLGTFGYANVKVFYRRFIESWLNSRNIEEILSANYIDISKRINHRPQFKSKYGGFILKFERTQVEQILKDSLNKGISGEEVVDKITQSGDTLAYSRLTFVVFISLSIILIVVIILSVLNLV
jgi:hypothetical protein